MEFLRLIQVLSSIIVLLPIVCPLFLDVEQNSLKVVVFLGKFFLPDSGNLKLLLQIDLGLVTLGQRGDDEIEEAYEP